MSKSLRALFYPIEGVGHVNACVGLGQAFQRRGHKVGFFIGESWRGKLDAYGFDVFYFQKAPSEEEKNVGAKQQEPPAKMWGEKLYQSGLIGGSLPDSYAVLKALVTMMQKSFKIDEYVFIEAQLTKVIEAFKPDVYLVDHSYCSPQIVFSGRPFVMVVSTYPTFYHNVDDVPPAGSGLATDSDRGEWSKYRKLGDNFHIESQLPELFARLGYPGYQDNRLFPRSYTHAIFGYPRELMHPKLQLPGNWLNIESFMRKEIEMTEFKIPATLEAVKEKYPGKLIFLSLGSMGSFDIDLMKRLVGILAKTSHRYIISKGPRHNELDLAENMWGDRFLPQTAILKVVDLVISHGGNNTFTETVLHGVPLIIMPMFSDQFDNAQRVVEAGIGARLEPYAFKDEELPEAIDRLLGDASIIQKMKNIAKRISGYDRFDEACRSVEQSCSKNL